MGGIYLQCKSPDDSSNYLFRGRYLFCFLSHTLKLGGGDGGFVINPGVGI